MKIPEKILITQDEDTKELSEHWCVRNLTNNPHIEYINKDAFIEKACKWMSNHLQMQYDGFSTFIKDFRKAMKKSN